MTDFKQIDKLTIERLKSLEENELVVFTHNDLDCFGCLMNIEQALPNTTKTVFHTNYANIDEQVKLICDLLDSTRPKEMIICDVSFSDNKLSLVELSGCARLNGTKITFIDHHLYPDGFFDEFDFTLVYSKSVSASALCSLFFGNKHETLSKLTYLIDVYDIWRDELKEFSTSQSINKYFWYKIRTENLTVTELMNEFKNRKWRLPLDFLRVLKTVDETNNLKIKEFNARGLIKRAGNKCLCFVDECFNEIMIEEMQTGKDIVVGVTSFGIVRIRFKKTSNYTDEFKNELRLKLTGTETIGHMNAFTYKMSYPVNFNTVMQHAQLVMENITRLETSKL